MDDGAEVILTEALFLSAAGALDERNENFKMKLIVIRLPLYHSVFFSLKFIKFLQKVLHFDSSNHFLHYFFLIRPCVS